MPDADPSRPCLVALDLGTSASRVLAFDLEGRVVFEARRAHAGSAAPERIGLLDPRAVRDAAIGLLGEAGRAVGRAAVGLGVSAQLGLALLDRDGRPVGPLSTWLDRRPQAEARALSATLGEAAVYTRTGRRPDAELAAVKLLRLKREDPARLARVRAVLSLKDYVVHLLTGVAVTDPTHASYSMLADVRTVAWAPDLAAEVGVSTDALPPIRPGTAAAGGLLPAVAEATGLPPGLPVAVGGPDGTIGAVGAGMTAPGVAVDIMGTSDVLLVATAGPRFDAHGRTLVNAHVLPGLWAAGGPMTTTGGSVQWLAESILGLRAAEVPGWLARVEAAAARLDPGCDGLVAVPSLVGERAPVWDPDARASFVGLGLAHRTEHLYRALLEGASHLVRAHVDVLAECGAPAGEIVLAGGGSRSALACLIRAAALGREVDVCAAQETTALGAAILAGVAAGCFGDVAAAARALVAPPARLAPPADLCARYAALAPAFHAVHGALRALRTHP